MFTRCSLKQTLVERVCEVTFKKTNGDLRTMKCTLNPELLPAFDKKEEPQKEENKSVLSVFDLDKKDWRSFKIENVIEFK